MRYVVGLSIGPNTPDQPQLRANKQIIQQPPAATAKGTGRSRTHFTKLNLKNRAPLVSTSGSHAWGPSAALK